MARSLRRRRSQTVGVLVPEIDEPYAAKVMSGIEDFLVRKGYFYLVASHQARQDRVDNCVGLLESRSVEGMVLVATPLSHPPRLPTVVVSGHQELEGVTNVVVDHERAAHLAFERLHELGHRRIALVKGQTGSAAFHNPGLTTVRQPLRQMGETASRILLDRLTDGRSEPDTVTLALQLVVRGSTGPAKS